MGRASKPSTHISPYRTDALGLALFNLLEGVIDHHLLNIHHVRDMPLHVPLYDWIFLAVGGVGFSVIGLLLARGTRQLAPPGA